MGYSAYACQTCCRNRWDGGAGGGLRCLLVWYRARLCSRGAVHIARPQLADLRVQRRATAGYRLRRCR